MPDPTAIENPSQQPAWRYSLRTLLLGVLVAASLSGMCFYSSKVKVVKTRADWPRELELLVAESRLSSTTIRNIEVIKGTPSTSGWYCRMPSTEDAISLIHSGWWVPITQCQQPQTAEAMFWRCMPEIWRSSGDSSNAELVAHKDIGFDEDDNGTAFVGMHDKDRDQIFIMFYYNF